MRWRAFFFRPEEELEEERFEAQREKRERALLEAEQGVMTEREDRLFLSIILLLIAFGLGQWAMALWHKDEEERDETRLRIVGGAAAAIVLAALAAYLPRPGLDEIDRRVARARDGSH